MNTLAKVIRALGWVFVGLAVLLNIGVHLMILIHQGFWTLLSELSPFNVRHLFTVGLTFLPGGVLLALANVIQRRTQRVGRP